MTQQHQYLWSKLGRLTVRGIEIIACKRALKGHEISCSLRSPTVSLLKPLFKEVSWGQFTKLFMWALLALATLHEGGGRSCMGLRYLRTSKKKGL